jgi:hypothetical protein
MREAGDTYIGGKLRGIQLPPAYDYKDIRSNFSNTLTAATESCCFWCGSRKDSMSQTSFCNAKSTMKFFCSFILIFADLLLFGFLI